jgi:hypothetical protein
MIDYSTLHPKPTFFVAPVFYGGPIDGLRLYLVEGDTIRGTIKHRGGAYSLQGFRATGTDDAPGADEAVYEWEVST